MPIEFKYLVGIIVVCCLAFYIFYPGIENFFIFFPQREFDQTPESIHLDYTDVFFKAQDDKVLHGWFFPLEKKAPVLLFCHGNAGNISHRLDNIRLLLQKGLQVFIFDYRGYGRSKGKPSEKGIFRDGFAACDYLLNEKKFSSDQIIVFGRSLGVAVAIEIAMKRNIKSMILESGFTSVKDMARGMPPFSILAPLLPANYHNEKKIAALKIPKLIIHGVRDELVPYYMAERLFDAALDPKFIIPLKDAGHNDTYISGGEKYFRAIERFVRESKI